MRRTDRGRHGRRRRRGGFTLMELLIVILIVLLIAAVALPVVIPAFNHRQVSAAASQLQAALVGSRDAAIRAAAPRGIRLLLDPNYPDPRVAIVGTNPPQYPPIWAFDRWVAIETAPDYSIGSVSVKSLSTLVGGNPSPAQGAFAFSAIGFNGVMPWYYPLELDNLPPMQFGPPPHPYPAGAPPDNLLIEEEAFQDGGPMPLKGGGFSPLIPNEPVNWWWNVRMGDKIQIGGEGAYYTVIGPCEVRPTNPATPGQNPELFVNVGQQGTFFPVSDTVTGQSIASTTGDSPMARAYTDPNTGSPFLKTVQFLILVNGVDDDGDGYTDSGWNGADENVNGIADDMLEWFKLNQAGTAFNAQEQEDWLGSLTPKHRPSNRPRRQFPTWDLPYTITRRPVPSPGARVTTLPANVVIDATTFGSTRERSRIPIDANSGYADILLNPNGTVVPTTVYSSPNSIGFSDFFFHFWLTERVDVVAPQAPAGAFLNTLPFPKGVGTGQPTYLQGERALVSLFTKTGQIVSNSIENFSPTDSNAPFEAAQAGAEEAK